MSITLNFNCEETGVVDLSGYVDSLTLTLSKRDLGAVNAAPHAVEFEVTDVVGAASTDPSGSVYDPKYHDIVYIWSFENTPDSATLNGLNLSPAFRDINKAYGKRVAHVFNSPGTRTVTCYAYERSTQRFGSATVSVDVNDPRTVFSGATTIIYDPSGVGDPANYPSANVQTTWSNVVSARTALGSTPALILIASGVTIANQQLAVPTNWSNIRIGPLNPNSAAPVIGPRGQDGSLSGDGAFFRDWDNDCNECVIYGIDFLGDWDSTTETGFIHRPVSINKSSFSGDYLTLYHKCNFSGFENVQGSYTSNASANICNMWSETTITNWQDYAINSGAVGVKTYVIGSAFEQHENALSGGRKIEFYNQHGSIRDFGSKHLGIRSTSLFARNGWSIGGSFNGRNRTAVNPALRINTSSRTDVSSCIDRCVIEGAVAVHDQNRVNSVPGNHLFDKVIQVLSADEFGQGFEIRNGGTTLRNILTVKMGVEDAVDGGLSKFIFLSDSNGSVGNGDVPIKLTNITAIDLRTDAEAKNNTMQLVENGGTVFTDITLENNIFTQPNRTPAEIDQQINLLSSIGVTPKSKGPRYNFQHLEGTFASDVSGAGGSFLIPYTDLTDAIYNYDHDTTGAATNQAYWQLNESVDTKHVIRVNGAANYHASDGGIVVAFESSNVRVTNNTGVTWTGSTSWRLKLDRSTRLAAFNPVYDITGQIVPTAEPQVGSPVYVAGPSVGLVAYDDINMVTRPSADNARGAVS